MSFLLLLFVVPRAFAGDECEDCLDMSCSEDCEFARSRWLRRCVPPDIVFFGEEREEIHLVKMKKIHILCYTYMLNSSSKLKHLVSAVAAAALASFANSSALSFIFSSFIRACFN